MDTQTLWGGKVSQLHLCGNEKDDREATTLFKDQKAGECRQDGLRVTYFKGGESFQFLVVVGGGGSSQSGRQPGFCSLSPSFFQYPLLRQAGREWETTVNIVQGGRRW